MKNELTVSYEVDDYLKAIATRSQECRLTYLNQKVQLQRIQGLIIDIYSDDAADWCKLNDGSIIRLDKIAIIEELIDDEE